MFALPARPEPVLMTELNTTPLIDVLLVLLVMLIITIPMRTHSIKLDLPHGAHVPQPRSTVNLLEMASDGRLLWNGQAIDVSDLRYELQATQQMQPTPELHFRPDRRARYEAVANTLAIIKREHVSKLGFVGNEAYRGQF